MLGSQGEAVHPTDRSSTSQQLSVCSCRRSHVPSLFTRSDHPGRSPGLA